MVTMKTTRIRSCIRCIVGFLKNLPLPTDSKKTAKLTVRIQEFRKYFGKVGSKQGNIVDCLWASLQSMNPMYDRLGRIVFDFDILNEENEQVVRIRPKPKLR